MYVYLVFCLHVCIYMYVYLVFLLTIAMFQINDLIPDLYFDKSYFHICQPDVSLTTHKPYAQSA